MTFPTSDNLRAGRCRADIDPSALHNKSYIYTVPARPMQIVLPMRCHKCKKVRFARRCVCEKGN